MRQYSIHQQRMLDVIPLIVGRPEGNDEIGYCCRINPGREDIPFYVVRINQSYRILLEGESSSELAKRAELFQMDGKHAEAIQWLDWAMRKLDAGNPLNAESGTAATVVWNSAKKKKAEMVELVVKMLLHQHRFDPEITAYLKQALETETSKFRKTQIHRCLVQGLAYHGPSDHYEENAKAFFEAYPGLWVEKARLISLLAANGHHEKAQQYLEEHSDSIPAQERTRLEQSVAWAKGDYSDIVQKRLEDTKRQPTAELWNSVLWTSLFADAVDDKLVRQSGTSILKSENPNIIHSLSYAEAETGNLNDAVQELHLILSYRGDMPDGVDWLIVGRIAEQCGLPDAAIESYRKVPKSEDLHSSHFLAQRRIKGIENPREDTTENETKP
jgi:tetratricopeptide (TPR) repeat protein